jgi:hypothetical protein
LVKRGRVAQIRFLEKVATEQQAKRPIRYRLVNLFGWSDLVNTRITARVPGEHDHFLINTYGLLFSGVTASLDYPMPAARSSR